MKIHHTILIFLTLFLFVFTSEAQTASRQDKFIKKILKQQVRNQLSIKSSVSSILTRFPEEVDSVLKIALREYPSEFRQIMIGAINAEPVLACDVIDFMLKENIADKDEIIAIAVSTEPAYAQEIINIAVLNDPSDIENIVRVAIATDPFASQSLVGNTMTHFPKNIFAILSGAIQALPENVSDFVKTTIDLFPSNGEKVVEKAVHSSESKYTRGIVNSAVNAGLNEKDAIEAAILGGALKEQFVKNTNK